MLYMVQSQLSQFNALSTSYGVNKNLNKLFPSFCSDCNLCYYIFKHHPTLLLIIEMYLIKPDGFTSIIPNIATANKFIYSLHLVNIDIS